MFTFALPFSFSIISSARCERCPIFRCLGLHLLIFARGHTFSSWDWRLFSPHVSFSLFQAKTYIHIWTRKGLRTGWLGNVRLHQQKHCEWFFPRFWHMANIPYTVKPLQNDHPLVQITVVFVDRWSLLAVQSLCKPDCAQKKRSLEAGGRYSRWSLIKTGFTIMLYDSCISTPQRLTHCEHVCWLSEMNVYSKTGCRRTQVLRGQARRSYLHAAVLSRSYLVQCKTQWAKVSKNTDILRSGWDVLVISGWIFFDVRSYCIRTRFS